MAIDRAQIENIVSLDYNWISGRASSQMGGRDSNQDCWGAVDTPHGFLVVVCDGMGGGQAGEIASRIAVDIILKTVQNAPANDSRKNIIDKAIRNANHEIMEQALQNPNYRGMGSTCIVLLINDYSAIAGYVGDSRIYQLEGRRKKWRTFDHSMVFSLVKQGVITEEQARLSAQSNVITRALGIKGDVQADVVELPFGKGDRFVLTTDGTHGVMPEEKLIERLTNYKEPLIQVTDDFVKEVETIGITNGGRHDNYTIAIIDVKKKSTLEGKMTKKSKQKIFCLAALLCLSLIWNMVQCSRLNKYGTNEDTMGANTEMVGTQVGVGDSDNAVIGDGSDSANDTQTSAGTVSNGETNKNANQTKAKQGKTNSHSTTEAYRDSRGGQNAPESYDTYDNEEGDGSNPLQKTLDKNKEKLEKTAAAKEKVEKAKKKQ